MLFTEKQTYVFVPDFEINGVKNLDQPKSQQVSGKITRPDLETKAEMTELEVVKKYSKKAVADAKAGKESAGTGEERKINLVRRQDTGRILRECLDDIKNVEVEEFDENGKKTGTRQITTGAELAESRAFGLDLVAQKFCAEILKDKLGEEEEKNSESPSNST